MGSGADTEGRLKYGYLDKRGEAGNKESFRVQGLLCSFKQDL